MGRVGVCAAGLVVLSSTCGGIAVIDGPGGAGGEGGSPSTSPSTASATSTTQGPATVTATTGGAATCDQACSALYDCGLEAGPNGMQLCQGFSGSPAEKNQFVADCVSACMQQPALIQLVDPDDCGGTIGTFKSLNAEFADACDSGF